MCRLDSKSMLASLTSLSVSPRNARNWCALKTPGLCSAGLNLFVRDMPKNSYFAVGGFSTVISLA